MDIDFAGAQGGTLAMAFAAGCTAAWAFLHGVLVGPLKTQIADLKEQCEAREAAQATRISQLETLLLLHGPGQLRQELQLILSEQRTATGS